MTLCSQALPRRLTSAALLMRLAALSILTSTTLQSQPVATPWGNVSGIQVTGETMVFETALRAVNPDWSGFVQSSKYNWEGEQTFTLEGKTHTCSHFLQGTEIYYTTRITDTGVGTAAVDLHVDARKDLSTAGTYFTVELPSADYAGASIEFLGADTQPLKVLQDRSGEGAEVTRIRAKGFKVQGAHRSLEVSGDVVTEILIRQDFVNHPAHLNDPIPRLSFAKSDPARKVADFQVYFSVLPASAKAGASARASYSIKAGGTIDREPVTLKLNPTAPGRRFAGVGGNYRMQYPELDAQVVDYCFKNLDVAWGRIAFPWRDWQPNENGDELAKALAGELSPGFYAQIDIARELARRHIPIILSVWAPPDWTVDASRKIAKGVKLDDRKLQKSADSIANFVAYLKNHYGIEVALFSFNETDYGVEVHQSSEEHALANRVIGSTFAARGLVTKMLLGDTGAGSSDANKIVDATVADRSLYAHLGAISFHNYHGLTDTDLASWAASAKTTNLPLLADEGGPDSAAHRYPLIFQTPWFAQLEVDQYVRIGATCQPNSILPWQLNADYSLLAGGGIYRDNGPLRPTQRFWSLKQLGHLSRAFWLPLSSDRPNISCAALGDIARGSYAVHITNNGAAREATVTGIPSGVKKMSVYVTDAQRGMQLMSVKGVENGAVRFQLEPQAFVSLFSE